MDKKKKKGEDFRLDVTNSRVTMDTFERLLKDEKEISVIIEQA